jgi:hypothetical protein
MSKERWMMGKHCHPAFFYVRAVAVLFALLLVLAGVPALDALKRNLHEGTAPQDVVGGDGQFVGRDFRYFYAAATTARTGEGALLYTPSGLVEAVRSSVPEGAVLPQMDGATWGYPPHYFLLIAPLSLLDYRHALAAFVALSVGAVWLAARGARARVSRWWLAPMPWLVLQVNVLFCLLMGQNALLMVSLMMIALTQRNKRVWLSGTALALLSMKPHFLPVAVLALFYLRAWRALACSALALSVLMALSVAWFGVEVWMAFVQGVLQQSAQFMSADAWFLQSFSSYRTALGMGAPSGVALAVQAAVALLALAVVYRGMRSLAGDDTQLAEVARVLLVGLAALLITPYSLAYDAVWASAPLMLWWLAMSAQERALRGVDVLWSTVLLLAYPLTALWEGSQPVLIAAALVGLVRVPRLLFPSLAD